MRLRPVRDHLGWVTFRLVAVFLILVFDVLFGIGAIAKALGA